MTTTTTTEKVSVAFESWSMLWPECEPLMYEHWKEVRENRANLPFAVNCEVAQRLDDAGAMICLGARYQGDLIGYLIWFITPNMESVGFLQATLGPFFVLPEHEGTGYKLWSLGLERLREIGVKTAHVHCSAVGKRREKVKQFWRLVGAKPYEATYELVL
jgi:GNAT superfamily N-acetyltransferase